MAKIIVNNPKQVINGGAKKYYFKVKGLGGLKGDKGDKGDTGAQGLTGANGADGFSPIATVTPTDTGATISITDVNGTTTANITNGTDGQNGANGQNGADGFSPIATVTQTSTGATISITDAQGTTTADIANGTGSNAPIATTSVAGIVKPDGSTIKVTADGTISSDAGYTLPAATNTTLGGIKVGSNLSITADGILSADAQQVTLYSTTGQNTDGAMTQKATTDALALKADSSSLAPVATSGNYNDLNNLPTPPTVNNGALTIQQNGTTLDTFTANSSDDKTVNIQTITAETVAPAEEVGAITASMIDWTTMPGSYSTTEQKTPFTWVDGKVICKKTVFIASYPNTAEKAVAHGITNLKQVIKLSGFMAISNGGAWPIPMPPNPLSSIETGITAFADQTNIVIRTGSDRSPYSGYITLWYTKTTD